jgi:BirA family biotin operon repressor/biotin-[acetyl-CoA-carboxylase] ligase
MLFVNMKDPLPTGGYWRASANIGAPYGGQTFKIRLMQTLLLNYDRILAGLSAPVAQVIALSVYETVESTNDVVRDHANSDVLAGVVVLAEEQTHGRGRRGRAWHSPAGGNLYLSMGWEFDLALERLSGLSLAVGAMLADAFAREFNIDLQLKWPNDFYYDGRKLGGILVEILPERHGRQRLVLGIGLNVAMPSSEPPPIDRPWTDMTAVIGAPIDRNELAAVIIDSATRGFMEFETRGFPHWLERWRSRDFLLGRSVTVNNPLPLTGTAAGVNEEGALLIEAPAGQCAVAGGEVSVLEFGELS